MNLKAKNTTDYMNSKDGTKLYYEKSIVDNPKATIIIIHGVCEHQGRYNYVVDKLNDKNYNVYRFDYRGHGKSDGKKAHIDDFNDVIDDTDAMVNIVKADEKNTKIFILGHSFGGFIAVAYGIKHKGKVDGFIVSSPTASDEAGILELFRKGTDKNEYVPNNLANLLCSDKKVCKEYMEDVMVHKEMTIGFVQEMIKGTKWIKRNISKFNYPVVLIHGKNDQIISYLDTEYLFEQMASKDKKLKIYQGMQHELLNEVIKDRVMEDLTQWIDERV
ncbi:MAG: hypothetical protein CVU84_07020 [Firmicutes bacterium HGW-Firmicutes-1]|jgi:lysophospholipase|nr:MAG: hypothetical protein CVU84_07020 [Firmicutes bacterium HGW-Firmicutes-1]